MRMPEMVAPGVSRFPTAGQGERRLWEPGRQRRERLGSSFCGRVMFHG